MKKSFLFVAILCVATGVAGYSIGRYQNQSTLSAASVYGIGQKNKASVTAAPITTEPSIRVVSNDADLNPNDPGYQGWIFTRRMCRGLGGTVVQIGTGWHWYCDLAVIQPTPGSVLIQKAQAVITAAGKSSLDKGRPQ